MRLSAWITFTFYVLPLSALAIPTASDNATDVAIAGPIANDEALHVPTDLEKEYQKLEILKAQLHDLHHKLAHQEHAILRLINEDFKTCTGMKCYFQTAVRKAPDFFELLRTHFRHHPLNNSTSPEPCPPIEKPFDPLNVPQDLSPLPPVEPLEHKPPPPFLEPFHSHDHPPADKSFDFPHDGPPHDKPFPFGDDPKIPHPPPFPPGKPGDFHKPGKDHKFPFEPPSEWRPAQNSPSDDTPWKSDKQDTQDTKDSPWKADRPDNPWKPNPHHPHHMPQPPPPPPQQHRLILATVGFIIAFLILAILLKTLHIYLANPRARANRAARLEEYRTRREYKRAACQHRFRKMLARLIRGPTRRDDEEEEKESMLQTTPSEERINEHIVGANIESLRRAHEIVGQLMRAEEGRTQALVSFPSNPTGNSTAPSVVSTLPLYVAPPPRYSQEISRDLDVVDGFRYTPSNSEATLPSSAQSFVFDDDDLTESSVVDCRSRMSMDTESATLSRKSLELAGDRYRGQFN